MPGAFGPPILLYAYGVVSPTSPCSASLHGSKATPGVAFLPIWQFPAGIPHIIRIEGKDAFGMELASSKGKKGGEKDEKMRLLQ